MSCKDCGDPVEGRSLRCEPCKKARRKAYAHEYYEANKETIKVAVRERYRNDPEFQRAYKRKYADRYKVRRLAKRYGITIEHAETLLAVDACEICGRKVEDFKAGRDICIDHDHETGEIRGRLCHECNRGLGLLGDTVEAITRALEYLTKDETT